MQRASSAAHHCASRSGKLLWLTSYRLRSAPSWLSWKAAGRFPIKTPFQWEPAFPFEQGFFLKQGKNPLFTPGSGCSNEESTCTTFIFTKKFPTSKNSHRKQEKHNTCVSFFSPSFFTQVTSRTKTQVTKFSLCQRWGNLLANLPRRSVELVPTGKPHWCKWGAQNQLLPDAALQPMAVSNASLQDNQLSVQLAPSSLRQQLQSFPTNLHVNMQERAFWFTLSRDKVAAVPQERKAIYFTGFKVIHAWVQEISRGIFESPMWVRTRLNKMVQWISPRVRFS